MSGLQTCGSWRTRLRSALNPDAKLPDTDLTVVHRSGGTTRASIGN
jgi:hypothetical protein